MRTLRYFKNVWFGFFFWNWNSNWNLRFKLFIIIFIKINCSDVVLFWRIQQVIKVTSNALRQQIVNREARRVDKEIKEVLGRKFSMIFLEKFYI
jgi:hypothetical protein